MRVKFPNINNEDTKRSSLGYWLSGQRKAYKKNRLSPERIIKLEQIPGWSWDHINDTWNRSYEELKIFSQIQGRIPFRREGFLGQWCGTQRRQHTKKRLRKDRVDKLEQIPGWSWNPFLDRWGSFYEGLATFVKRNNRLPQVEEPTGQWAQHQRTAYGQGKLSQPRINKLEQISGWSWNHIEERWNVKYGDLLTFVQHNGKLPSRSENRVLGVWVHNLRSRRNKLSQRQISQLEQIPTWSWNHPGLWEINYEKLVVYVRNNGRAPSRRDNALGGWVTRQRQAKERNKLSQTRVRNLEQIPGWSWKPFDHKWDAAYDELVSYIRGNNGLPTQDKWVNAQRRSKALGTLTEERIRKLEQIPGWSWKPFDHKWETAYQTLQTSVEEKIPFQDKTKTWCSKQRQEMSKGILAEERIRKLEQIPGWSWKPFDHKWETGYRELKIFVKKTGRIPSQTETSGRWGRYQREARRKGYLSQERIEQLEVIPGWYWAA